MSTTDKEQVTPTVEAKLSSDEVKALREKKDQLSTSIRQTVLDPKAKLPEEGSAQQLRSEHVQLTEQAETAKQQAERLTEAKLQVEPLVQECQGLEKELATARESLNEFYQPLGVAAFAGQLAGQIKDVSALADRLVVHEKVTQLQQEREALTPSADAKMLEKTKAKAQQLAAAGKIKIEQTKIGKLDKQIGQQLLGEQQEETVRCDETSAILDQISERRAEISEKEGKVAESTASFASSRDEVTKKLDLPPFETVAELDIQIKENNTLTASAQKQLTLLERELPERLMADEELRSSDSELGQQVQELAEIQAQLKTAGPSLAGLWSKAKEVVVRRKRTVAVIGVLLLGLLAFAIYEESQLNKATQQQIAAAASAWEAGTQKEAAAIYRDLISKKHVRFVSAEDKETVFHRLIEYDVAHEARPEAKRLVERALDEEIRLTLESPAAQSLLAEVEKEIEEERAAKLAALAKKKRAEEKKKSPTESDENVVRSLKNGPILMDDFVKQNPSLDLSDPGDLLALSQIRNMVEIVIKLNEDFPPPHQFQIATREYSLDWEGEYGEKRRVYPKAMVHMLLLQAGKDRKLVGVALVAECKDSKTAGAIVKPLSDAIGTFLPEFSFLEWLRDENATNFYMSGLKETCGKATLESPSSIDSQSLGEMMIVIWSGPSS